ncbi:MAG: hypothetical protein JWP22_3759 [Ramlibacter sp.]|jgi:hypothetical protein|nr:hypothetical protein [Ramlibacter sp.]MDB5915084.1 hypothetical protein [Ramlibacter sp.]
MTSQTPAPGSPPADEPKPANPEPTTPPVDPEKGAVRSPGPGKSEHPKQ